MGPHHRKDIGGSTVTMDLEAFDLQTAQLRWNAHWTALEEIVGHAQTSCEHGFAPLSHLRLLEAKLDRSLLSGDRALTLIALADAERVEALIAPSNVASRGLSAAKRWWKGTEVSMMDHMNLAVYALVMTYKGLLQVQTGSKVAGFLSLGHAQSAFNKLPDLDGSDFESRMVCASKQFGQGMFMVVMSYLPPRLVGFLELVGYKFDRVEGVQLLQACVAGGVYNESLAKALLAVSALLESR